MTGNKFNFCPICGGKNISYRNSKKWLCSDCGFDLYNNVASAVGVIISDKNNNILVEIRAKNPGKGLLALPGGFCDYDESAEDAVYRECQEEIGIKPESVSYLASFPNDYEYKEIHYKTCDLFFSAKLSKNEGTIKELLSRLKLQESEVTDVKTVSIKTEDDVEKLPFAFNSARKALKVWLKGNSNGIQ